MREHARECGGFERYYRRSRFTRLAFVLAHEPRLYVCGAFFVKARRPGETLSFVVCF